MGPNVQLIMEKHRGCMCERKNVYSLPIAIKREAWTSAGATFLANISIGEFSIVAAASVATIDIPPASLWGSSCRDYNGRKIQLPD